MQIESTLDLERAVREFERLQDAKRGSSEERRRNELDGAIKAYYNKHKLDLERGQPGK